MKRLNPEADLNRFIRVIADCQDGVLFTTQEGDILNLKSTLSTYIFAALADRADVLLRGRIDCHNPEDEVRLADFLIDVDE